MRLLDKLSSTSLSGWKLDGIDFRGYPRHSKRRNSVERKPTHPESFALHIFNSLSLLIFENGSAFKCSSFTLEDKNMPSTACDPYNKG